MKVVSASVSADELTEKLVSLSNKYHTWISKIHLLEMTTVDGMNLFDSTIPTEWKDYIQTENVLDSFADYLICGNVGGDWPLSLREFVNTTNETALTRLPNPSDFDNIFSDKFAAHTMDDCRSLGLSKKKIHEVDRLQRLVLGIAQKSHADFIVDVGCGVGYLTHELGIFYPVVGIEADPLRVEACACRSRKRNKHFKTTTNVSLVPGYVSFSNLNELIETGANSLLQSNSSKSCLLTGLHACGDLSVHMLTQFLESPNIQSFVGMGCCYQHLTTFPSSLKLHGRINFDRRALKLACQSFINFDKDRLTGLWYNHASKNPNGGLNDITVKRIALMSLLKQCLSFCIESLLLLDRFFLIRERGFTAHLLPLFDYSISTRNMVLIGIKE
jgi:hypothetical protein